VTLFKLVYDDTNVNEYIGECLKRAFAMTTVDRGTLKTSDDIGVMYCK
jgi:hypothetical protein